MKNILKSLLLKSFDDLFSYFVTLIIIENWFNSVIHSLLFKEINNICILQKRSIPDLGILQEFVNNLL